MSQGLSTAAEDRPDALGTPAVDRRRAGMGWRRLQVVAALAVVVALLAPMLITRSFEPFLVGMVAPLVVGLPLARRWPRVAAVWLGVVSLALVAFSAPFLADALAHPEALADFVPLSVFAVAAVVCAAAAIPAYRQPAGAGASSRPALVVALVAGGLIVVLAATSMIAFAAVDSVAPEAGDVELVTADFAFSPTAIEASSGTVAVHVTNNDSTRHTFTIDELGVDLNLPPNSTQRVSFTADPGTYRFYCVPHTPGMEGELTVE